MEYLADSEKRNIDHKNLEHFHYFLRGYTDISTNNIYATKDYTYHNLRGMIQNKDIVVVKGDKASSVVITKLDTIVDGGINKGTYVETTETFISMSSIKICNLIAVNQHAFVEQLKPTNLKLYRTLLQRT